MKDSITTSEQLEELINSHKNHDTITFGNLVTALHEGGFGLLLILFSAPTALPLPALPGLTFILSLPILFLSAQMFCGIQSPKLPRKLSEKEIKMTTLIKVVEKLNIFLKKIEKILKPRMHFLSSRLGERVVGLICFICGISVAMPFPFTNTIPSMGIVIISVGLLERDGAVMLLGTIVGAAGITIAFSVYFLGLEAVKSLF